MFAATFDLPPLPLTFAPSPLDFGRRCRCPPRPPLNVDDDEPTPLFCLARNKISAADNSSSTPPSFKLSFLLSSSSRFVVVVFILSLFVCGSFSSSFHSLAARILPPVCPCFSLIFFAAFIRARIPGPNIGPLPASSSSSSDPRLVSCRRGNAQDREEFRFVRLRREVEPSWRWVLLRHIGESFVKRNRGLRTKQMMTLMA